MAHPAVTTAGLLAAGVAHLATPAHAASRTTSTRSSWTSRATRTGSVRPSAELQVAVWLKTRNAAALHRRVRAIYTRGSGHYHHYLTRKQVADSYAPTRHQVAVVARYLRKQGLHVDSAAGNRAYVNATGTVAQIDRAFSVDLGTYRYHGHTYRGTAKAPRLKTIAGGHIASIGGLDTAAAYRPMIRGANGRRGSTKPAASDTPYDGGCGDFSTTKTLSFINPTETKSFTGFIPCNGYTGADLQKAYGVDQLPAGAGQTVAIVDAYGSPTILQDANTFSRSPGSRPWTAATSR